MLSGTDALCAASSKPCSVNGINGSLSPGENFRLMLGPVMVRVVKALLNAFGIVLAVRTSF